MTVLIKYDAACRALAQAKAVDEVKDVRDKADAMRIYAMQAKNKTLEIDAAEIRIRAERRLGEMIAQQKETVGLNRGGNPNLTSRDQREVGSPTLKEAGISHDLSSRAQKLAAVPEEEFEAEVGQWRDRVQVEGVRVTTRLEKAGEREINKTNRSEPKPEYVGADEDEISNLMQEMQEELETLRKIVESDDHLKAALEEIKRLKAVERGLQSRFNGVMAEKAEAIQQAKKFQRQVERLKKELGHV